MVQQGDLLLYPLARLPDDTARGVVMKPDLRPGECQALRLISKVLDGQADEEPNRWYAFWKRRYARKAMRASTVEDPSAERNQARD